LYFRDHGLLPGSCWHVACFSLASMSAGKNPVRLQADFENLQTLTGD
jgi:hypothetical protein